LTESNDLSPAPMVTERGRIGEAAVLVREGTGAGRVRRPKHQPALDALDGCEKAVEAYAARVYLEEGDGG